MISTRPNPNISPTCRGSRGQRFSLPVFTVVICMALFTTLTTASESVDPTFIEHMLRGGNAKVNASRLLQTIPGIGCSTVSTSSTTCAGARASYKPGFGGTLPTVDGDLEDWGECPAVGIPMYEAGDDIDHDLAAKAFVHYFCDLTTLCVLVKAESGHHFSQDDENTWIKSYKLPGSGLPDGEIAYGTDTAGNTIAWEGCFMLSPDCHDSIEIHSNFGVIGDSATRTASTGKKQQGGPGDTIALDLSCICQSNDDCTSADHCISGTCDNSVCNYQEAYIGCCEDDNDCGIGQQCLNVGDVTGTGECTTITPPTGGTPVCSLPPDEDVSLCTAFNPTCAEAHCIEVEGTPACSYTATGVTTTCDETPPEGESDNSCFLGNFCFGIDCVPTWSEIGVDCLTTTPSPYDERCAQFVCRPDPASTDEESSRTICTEEFFSVTTRCDGDDFESRGICDDGDKCDGAGHCDEGGPGSHMVGVCRESQGCCDAPDECPQYDDTVRTEEAYECSVDSKYGPETTCRNACTLCSTDIAEVCPGDSNFCPRNIVLDSTLCVMAGQTMEAGTVDLVATEFSDGVEVCATLSLDDGWELQPGDESIKIYFSSLEVPDSSPGRYTIKQGSQDFLDGQAICKTFLFVDGLELVYFALHLDVTHPTNGGQTAWATGCTNSLSGGLSVNRFTQTNKKGIIAYQGWGQYFTWTACGSDTVSTAGDETCENQYDCPHSTPPGPTPDGVTWDCSSMGLDGIVLNCNDGETPQCLSVDRLFL